MSSERSGHNIPVSSFNDSSEPRRVSFQSLSDQQQSCGPTDRSFASFLEAYFPPSLMGLRAAATSTSGT